MVNSGTLQLPPCALSSSSAINNSPRADVWLAGRICCNSRARPASKFLESVVIGSSESKFSIVPATGLHSESNWFRVRPSEGYLQSKDLQRIFSQFLVFRIGLPEMHAESGVLPGRKAIPLRVSERPIQESCHSERLYREEPASGFSMQLSCCRLLNRGFPMWKSSGNSVGSDD